MPRLCLPHDLGLMASSRAIPTLLHIHCYYATIHSTRLPHDVDQSRIGGELQQQLARLRGGEAREARDRRFREPPQLKRAWLRSRWELSLERVVESP